MPRPRGTVSIFSFLTVTPLSYPLCDSPQTPHLCSSTIHVQRDALERLIIFMNRLFWTNAFTECFLEFQLSCCADMEATGACSSHAGGEKFSLQYKHTPFQVKVLHSKFCRRISSIMSLHIQSSYYADWAPLKMYSIYYIHTLYYAILFW